MTKIVYFFTIVVMIVIILTSCNRTEYINIVIVALVSNKIELLGTMTSGFIVSEQAKIVYFHNHYIQNMTSEIIIVFNIKIFFQCPIYELCEEDLIASVLVDQVELRVDIGDWTNPLKNIIYYVFP